MGAIANTYVESFYRYHNELTTCRQTITAMQANLEAHEQNPHFYRNKKIVAVAVTVGIIAAVAFSTYYMLAVGAPLTLMASPLLGLLPLKKILPDIFVSHDEDLYTLRTYQDWEWRINDRIQHLRLDLHTQIDRYNIALSGFNQESWDAMNLIYNKTVPFTGNERQQATWVRISAEMRTTLISLQKALATINPIC